MQMPSNASNHRPSHSQTHIPSKTIKTSSNKRGVGLISYISHVQSFSISSIPEVGGLDRIEPYHT